MTQLLSHARVPVLGFVAPSGTGKTTLLTRLLPLLRAQGLRIGMVKHTHHQFDIDQPGKDSYRLRAAGAQQMMIASRKRWALLYEHPEQLDEPRLDELLRHLDQDRLDLILVEGFKHEAYDKIELHRAGLGKPCQFPQDPHIVAVASDRPAEVLAHAVDGEAGPHPALLDINRPDEVAAFVLRWLARKAG